MLGTSGVSNTVNHTYHVRHTLKFVLNVSSLSYLRNVKSSVTIGSSVTLFSLIICIQIGSVNA